MKTWFFGFFFTLTSCKKGSQGSKTIKMRQNFYCKCFFSMVFNRKIAFNFCQSNAFIDIGWLEDAKNEYITVRSHRVIEMSLISEAIDDKSFYGKISQLLLSSWAVAQQRICTLPRKTRSRASSWPEFCLFLTKHSFSVGMKPSKHAGNRGRCSSACFTEGAIHQFHCFFNFFLPPFLFKQWGICFSRVVWLVGSLSSSLAAWVMESRKLWDLKNDVCFLWSIFHCFCAEFQERFR